MANLSDAFGTITVERVGKEFLDYLRAVQGSDEQAYYKLVEIDQLNEAIVDKNGDTKINFSTYGRWNYGSNIKGYLEGEWSNFREDSEERKAYSEFCKAVVEKNGVVDIDYTDSDGSMDWMGTGGFRMWVEDGKVQTAESFEEEGITIKGYADLIDSDVFEALEVLKGDEVVSAYDKYLKQEGEKAEDVDVWYDEIYEG